MGMGGVRRFVALFLFFFLLHYVLTTIVEYSLHPSPQ